MVAYSCAVTIINKFDCSNFREIANRLFRPPRSTIARIAKPLDGDGVPTKGNVAVSRTKNALVL